MLRFSKTHERFRVLDFWILRRQAMADVKMTVLDNGPLLVQGSIELLDSSGAVIETKSEKIALCRCGASVSKPFCDGQHSKIGFQAAAQAVPDSAE